MSGLGKFLILLLFFLQNIMAFCQWEIKSVQIPVVECINPEFFLVIDTIVDMEKKCTKDSLRICISITKLPKDTNVLYIYITLAEENAMLGENAIGFFRYANCHCFIYYSLPNEIFTRLNYSVEFKYKQLKKKSNRNKNPVIMDETDISTWKYHFYDNAFYLLEANSYCW